MRRVTEASLRFEERRRRENEAPRLHTAVPHLATLRLEVEERRGSMVSPETKHARHIVVDSAPALFIIPCGDSSCRDGGHDVTYALMQALTAGRERCELDDTCNGSVGNIPCGRMLHIVAVSTYR